MRVPKMYVLTRNDLSETYRMVQGAHALAAFSNEHPEKFKMWGNQTLIFLCVRNLIELEDWVSRLDGDNIDCSVFYEPDLKDQPTALAYWGDGLLFKNLKTVK